MQNRLILMLKYPRPGAVKTRLVPALGARRACELYRALVRHTLEEVERLAARGNIEIEARVAEAPDEAAARFWLGPGMTIRDQGGGDLGERMNRAVQDAFAEKADTVVLIGGDCPQLTAEHLIGAFVTLAATDAVIGPAIDGGYYLIGMRRPLPMLFQNIPWSGAAVLAQTLAAARALPVEIVQLTTLSDLDTPDDLPVWAETSAARSAGLGGVSVIIPAINEQQTLPATLAAVQAGTPHEIIVVDAGSTDRTTEIAREHDAIVLAAPAGRAGQMNCGAASATGEYLLFLHADTLLPDGYSSHVRNILARPGVAGGAFEFAITGEFPGRKLIEWGTNWRARHRQMPYGDQGIFVRRDTFERVGGFPELPIMEDYAFIRRLQALGKIALAAASARTSSRRWRRRGPLRTTLLNQLIVLGFRCGISPARLARWYRRV